MSVIDRTLFGDIDKVEIAIKRLREFEPEEGYYLAFSGGKDSQTIYHLAKEAGVKFDAHFNLTTVDPPELVYFIRENYPDVEVHRPRKSMWELIIENGTPPTRLIRYCCRELKEGGGENRLVLTGIRWAESVRRAKRVMVESCLRGVVKQFLHPIIDWSEDDVWDYIKGRGLEYCKLYDMGWKRIGCIGCPMGNAKGMTEDFGQYPQYKKNYIKAFDKMILERSARGKDTRWKTGEEVMEWWIHGTYKDKNLVPDQSVMFE